jgi:hypothetical protein
VRAEIASLVAPSKNAKPARLTNFWQQYRNLYVELFDIDGTPQWVQERILDRVDRSLRIARGQELHPAIGLAGER